jgi:hypothetical protein
VLGRGSQWDGVKLFGAAERPRFFFRVSTAEMGVCASKKAVETDEQVPGDVPAKRAFFGPLNQLFRF